MTPVRPPRPSADRAAVSPGAGVRLRPVLLAAAATATLFAAVIAPTAAAQDAVRPVAPPVPLPCPDTAAPPAVWTVMPQRPQSRRPGGVSVASVAATVDIDGPVATTRLRVGLRNSGSRPLEAELVIPVPDGAAIRGFGLEGVATDSDGNPTAELLPRDEARRIYRQIVSRMIDPGLLEFAGWNLIKSSVFPVPAGGEQFFNVAYEHVLPADGSRREYVLPRSESLDQNGAAWSLEVTVRGADDAAIFSPSHEVDIRRTPGAPVRTTVSPAALAAPGAFRLTVIDGEKGELPSTLVAFPDPSASPDGGGYFMFVTGAPDALSAPSQRREVTIVIDRSGSMRGAKIEQARAAALQIIEALDDGETFNIIDYSDTIALFRPQAVAKSAASITDARAYLAGVKAIGGTNIHDAVVEALRPAPQPGCVPMVLFLTDGLPTIGERSEGAIRAAAEKSNLHGRRLFTFGVGFDVNAPLLVGMARDTRAAAAFVLPDEDVEVKVGGMFRKLGGPVLTEPTLVAEGTGGGGSPIRDVQPDALPDLFAGDQLVILGRYVGEAPATLTLRGRSGDLEIAIARTLDPSTASTRHPYVPRLWAQRRIAGLLDRIRLGEGDGAAPEARTELVDEIVRLSLEHGILTEYTAFLAAERPDMVAAGGVRRGLTFGAERDFDRGGGSGGGGGAAGAPPASAPTPVTRDSARAIAGSELSRKAVRMRAGQEAVAQDLNILALRGDTAKIEQWFLDSDMNEVSVVGCQNVADRSLFRRSGQWVDSRLLARAIAAEDEAARAVILDPARTVDFGSEAYLDLIDVLVAQRRQALLAIPGELLLELDGTCVLVRNPA